MKLIDRQYLGHAVLRGTQNSRLAEKPEPKGQPETCTTADASDGSQGYLPASQDQRAGERPHGLSLPVKRPEDNKAKSGLGGGHHLYPHGTGILYLVAIIDWYSRYVLAWRLSNTLDTGFCVEALEEALKKGKPEIFNTDQGAQFTGEAFTGLLKQHGIRISMDGKGSYNDNLFIERLWRSVKV